MHTPAQIAKHPIHPMLVSIPIGLWVFSLVCDFIARGSAAPGTWQAAALYSMVGGIIGGLCAAIPGLIDLLSLPAPIQSTAIKHGGLNVAIVLLYIINAVLRYRGAASGGLTLGLSVIGILALLVSGWLGGKMVFEAGVAVNTEDLQPAGSNTWRSEGSRGWNGAGAPLRGERAMASDLGGPDRDATPAREDRATANPDPDDGGRP